MKQMKSNQGIVVTGGSIHADQIAVGTDASATKTVLENGHPDEASALKEIRDAISHLIEEMDRHHREARDYDQAVVSATSLVDESQRAKPRRPTVYKLLDKIATCFGSVAAIAKAIAAIRVLTDKIH